MTDREKVPVIRQVVLDGTDIRTLAEFYRQLLGLAYRPGDEDGDAGWLVLRNPGGVQLAFQRVDVLPSPSWPDNTPVPQQFHLDMTVDSVADLDAQHTRVLSLGGQLLLDRSEDPDEPLRVYADPAGHPFCVFVAPPPHQEVV
ncbi:VOC family protein [Allokutzneria sp. NRRL B-24872]|uniref:VOC family protein n=1 Tax=Allokutzneria sp. NRRL B-24872 TaxID=1137961 RepID=UPI000A3AF018|nr:VOC family protein [Allokutzneria sp. NRRL B-24872]